MQQPRFYRSWGNQSLVSYTVTYQETDLLIRAICPYPEFCLETIIQLRTSLNTYIAQHPQFLHSLKPVTVFSDAPKTIREMASCARLADVGPMATVAGKFAAQVGEAMLTRVDEVVVENGGDIFLSVKEDCTVGLYAGENSPFTGKVGIRVNAKQSPLGICTSAGTVGPSLSFGSADAVTVLSQSTPLADAVATAAANRIKRRADIDSTLSWASSITDVSGIIIIKDRHIGIWGDIEVVKTRI